jgi:hypothetical protein
MVFFFVGLRASAGSLKFKLPSAAHPTIIQAPFKHHLLSLMWDLKLKIYSLVKVLLLIRYFG